MEVRISSGAPPQCQMSSLRLGKPIAPCAYEPWQVAQLLLKIAWPSLIAAGSLAISSIGRSLLGATVSSSRASSAAFARPCSSCDVLPLRPSIPPSPPYQARSPLPTAITHSHQSLPPHVHGQ